jgi:hypothetical protein
MILVAKRFAVLVVFLFLASCGGGGGGGSQTSGNSGSGSGGSGGGGSGGGGSGSGSSCSVCTNLSQEIRELTIGDSWSYSGSTTSSGGSAAFTIERTVVSGPTYSLGTKSQATRRVTTQFLDANRTPTDTTNEDYAFTSGDRRLRLLAEDGFVLNGTSFTNDNYPVVFLSPLGVGLSWSYDSLFINPTGSGTNEAKRFTLTASVVGTEQIQTTIGTFNTYKITYQRSCRRGFTTLQSLACDGDFLNEAGTIWIYPGVGIIQNTGTSEYGVAAGTIVGSRISFSYRLTKTNFTYN